MKALSPLALIVALLVPSVASTQAFAQSGSEYTVLVYMVGSNLESDGEAATTDILEMLDGDIDDSRINLLVLTGGANTDDFGEVKIRQVTGDGLVELANWGSYNMGDPQLLQDFLIESIQAFPADNYALLFWNHGSGVQGFGADELYGNDNLDINELTTALANAKDETGVTFELVGFDACNMATAEVAYNLRDYASYLASSEEFEPAHGWDWTAIVDALSEDPSMSGADLGIVIADSYQQHAIANSYSSEHETITMSVIDLGEMDGVVSGLDEVASGMSSFEAQDALVDVSYARIYAEEYGKDEASQIYFDLVDLTDFLILLKYEKPELESEIDSLISEIDDAVIYSVSGKAKPYAGGMSIYLPFYGEYFEGYDSIEFSNSWKGFVQNYRAAMAEDTLAPTFESEGIEDNELEAQVAGEDVIQNYVAISRYDSETGREQILGQYPVGIDEEGNVDFTWDSTWYVLCNEQDCSEASFFIDWISDTQLAITVPAEVNGEDANMMYIYDIEYESLEFLGYWPGLEDTGAQKELLGLSQGDIVNTLMLEYDPEVEDFIYTLDGVDIVVDDEFGLYYLTLPEGEYYATFLAQDAAGNWGISESILVESSGSDTYTEADYSIDEEPVGLQEEEEYDEPLVEGEIEGTYSSEDAGFSIELPEGWKGIDFLGIVIAAPGGVDFFGDTPEATMAMFAVDRSMIEEASSLVSGDMAAAEEQDAGECEGTSSYVTVNGVSALHAVEECTAPDGYSKSSVYVFTSEESLIGIAFSATSQEAYDASVGDFEQSIGTLKIQNPIGAREGIAQTLSLETTSYDVQALDTEVQLEIQSNSQVSDFAFDEENRQIAFTVEGEDGTPGTTSIVIDRLLEGPYSVAIDGEVAQDVMVIEDAEAEETILMINYDHSVHQVTITGTQVVPEFPVAAILAAAAIGSAVALTRSRRT